ncbi:biotin/lipoyl-binding protein, partial [Aquitalea sp. ASV11]
MNKKRMVAGLLVLGLLAAGIWHWQQGKDGAELVLSGNVDIREVNLSFRVGGRLQQVLVDEGATVKAGQIL